MDHRSDGLISAAASLKKYRFAALIVLLGALLMLLPKGSGEKKAEADAGSESFDRAAVQSEMEEILSGIEGVGKLRLMLTVDGDTQYDLARDTSRERRTESAEAGTYTEKSETVILGSGSSAEIVVTGNRYPAFLGALVVCEGADSAAVCLELTQAIGALTGLSSEKISIIKGKP